MTGRQLVVAALGGICRVMWGFPPRMIPYIVAWRGTARGLLWFMVNMPCYLWVLYAIGPVRTHLACIVISLYNGCRYCAYGHAYALELIYLRDHDRLFPVDARTIAGWYELETRRIAAQVRVVLQEAGMHVEAMWSDRILGLASGEQYPIDRDEARLMHLVRIVGLMNTVAIANSVEPDEAHDTVNKNRPLKLRYAQLRALGAA